MSMTPYEQAFQIGSSYAPRTVPSRSILEIELEAREHGLSYGLYLAGHRLTRELEEAAAKRQAELAELNARRRKEAKRLMKRRALERAERPKPDRTPRKRYSVAVAEIDLEGNVLRVFPSGKAAADATGASPSTVCQSCERYALGIPRKNYTSRGAGCHFARVKDLPEYAGGRLPPLQGGGGDGDVLSH